MNRFHQQQGFTAVELLITLFVAAAFLLAGYQLFNIVIKDGGDTRAESRASNIAYDYLRQYSNTATNPCTPQSPMTDQLISVNDLSDVKVSVALTCPQPDAPALSKVETIISYGKPTSTVRYATYVDKSKGASPDTDITNGLVGRYLLNGNANADVGGVNGVVYGAVPTTDRNGKPNSAYAFNAAVQYQYIEIPSTLGLGIANVTISMWVYQASATGSGQYVRVGIPAGYGLGMGNTTMDNSSPGTKLFGIYEGIRWIDTNTNLGAGWHFIAMTLDSSGSPSIYRDGALVGTFTGGNSQMPNNMIRIGGSGGRFVTGSIDDVRFYNRPLSGSEINQLYTLGPK